MSSHESDFERRRREDRERRADEVLEFLGAEPVEDTSHESPSERTCALCGRKGTRGFMPSLKGGWVCRSDKACERRIRGTAQVGVGVMRSHVR